MKTKANALYAKMKAYQDRALVYLEKANAFLEAGNMPEYAKYNKAYQDSSDIADSLWEKYRNATR